MKIQPAKNHIQISMSTPTAGVLNTSMRQSAIEIADVVAVATDVSDYKKGDKVFVKAWGIDIVDHEGKKYYFVDLDSHSIKGIIR